MKPAGECMKYLYTVLILIISIIQVVSGQETAKETMEKLLNEIKYDFETSDDGIYYVTLEFEDSRTQLVRIEPFKSTLTNKIQFEIWTPVVLYTAGIPDSIANRLLIENSDIEIGRFESFENEDGYLVVLSALFYGKFDKNILKTIIAEVAAVSDIFEFDLTQKDDY